MTQLSVDGAATSPGKPASAVGAVTGRAPRPPNLGLGLQAAGAGNALVAAAMVTPHKDLITSSPYPHLAHYVATLLQSVHQPSPPRQHPLSVSSSGESDEDTPPGGRSRDEVNGGNGAGGDHNDPGAEAKSDSGLSATTTSTSGVSGGRRVSGADKEKDKEIDKAALVQTIVNLLDNEEEEKVKDVLKPYLGELANDEILMEQVCLDCMHKRKDDQEQLPFTPMNVTPSRPRLTPHVSAPLRPYSPSRVPSFRAATPLGRPQSPLLSGTVTPTGLPQPSLIRHDSASKLPTLGLANPGLSAKASAFNPSPRISSPSAGGPTIIAPHAHTWIPADAWKDAPVPHEPLSRTASPFGGATMARTSSNLAIAAPLFSDQSSPFHSPIGTPLKGTVKMPDVFSSPSAHAQPTMARVASTKALIPDDDDDDEFSPFGTGLPKLHHQDAPALQLNSGAHPFEPFAPSSAAGSGSAGPKSSSSLSQGSADYEDALSDGGAGMTPLDVLHQVFTALPRQELEAALHASGYDFEGAMAALMAQHGGTARSGASTPGRTASPRPLMNIGGRGLVQGNHQAPTAGYFNQGGRNFAGGFQQQPYAGAGHGHGARTPGGLKMCRYYLNGECRRSDCRFSHDLDRALCRFWLRGNCAKGPNCEFLHQLPPNLTQQAASFDPMALSSAMSRLELSSDGSYRRSPAGTPTEEFPDLMGARFRPGNRFDPSRNRFANALKRPQFAPAMPGDRPPGHIHVTGARMGHGHGNAYGGSGSAFAPPDQRNANLLPTAAASHTIPTPKASSRLRLRAPTLLPTISTGAIANEQYLASRQTAIRLGHARNACLARAADAFRRGDGAAAKRFSREGKSLNERMLHESAEAAAVLVKERMGEAQRAIRERDPAWSDEPADRSMRGKEAGGGFGVVMGVAGIQKIKQQAQGQGQGAYQDTSIEERTECMCDLHTLHGVEAVEVLGAFLAELEKERFRGLTYLLVGEEKHVGMQDPHRGTSKVRLAHSVKVYLTEEGYPWMEGQGWICVDSCRS